VRRPRGAVRYHVPRERSPVPALLVGALVVLTLVSAQLSLVGESTGTASGGTAAGVEVDVHEPADNDGGARGAGPGGASTAPADAGLPQPVEVTFDVGSDEPAGDADALLGPVVEALLADPTTRVRVVGHAEQSRDPVLEEQLSLRRAETVLGLLVARGMPRGRADVLAAGATEVGRSVSGTDRRVTVQVVR